MDVVHAERSSSLFVGVHLKQPLPPKPAGSIHADAGVVTVGELGVPGVGALGDLKPEPSTSPEQPKANTNRLVRMVPSVWLDFISCTSSSSRIMRSSNR